MQTAGPLMEQIKKTVSSNVLQTATAPASNSFFTERRPPVSNNENSDNGTGPSWGLIIPIIMIGVFLISVGLCLWWHKWRDKRTLHLQRDNTVSSSFHRSYRGSRSARTGFDAVRDSTRSTTPLRSSLNEKIASNNNIVKVKNVNVIPVQQRHVPPGKFSFYWDKTHWKAYQNPTAMTSSGRIVTKPLSPIDEIDSPSSVKVSEMSRNFDISAQASFSPYHMTWFTSSNPPSSHGHPELFKDNSFKSYPPLTRRSAEEKTPKPNIHHQQYETSGNSPFYPNNNTPTTECDTGSEASQLPLNDKRDVNIPSSQYTSYPSSPKSSIRSFSNAPLSISTETVSNGTSLGTSLGTSFPESSAQNRTTSADQTHSSLPTSAYPSGNTSGTDYQSTNLSSLPSSIARFSKQNPLLDDNNNSMVVPNSYLSFPMSKIFNYTLASSVASSDTHVSDNTSLLPNVGSNNNSGYPGTTASRSFPQNAEMGAPTSPEDLSKLVDEMSSIRPVEESSSMRPNSSFEPASRIVSISGHSLSAELRRSWSGVADGVSESSANTGSQNSSQSASLYWDSYPLDQCGSKSIQDLPLQVDASLLSQAHQYSYHRPVLMETQYWV